MNTNAAINTVVVMLALSVTGCMSNPERGDMNFAPVKPMYVTGPVQHSDSIYQASTSMLLHEDLKARRIGDMLTVTLEEQTDAEKVAETDTRKDLDILNADPTLLGTNIIANGNAILNNQMDSAHAFSATGDTSQSNTLSGSVTVTVVDVQANGNLVVQGEKWIKLNQGQDYIRLRGIVRPMDINPDNTISSTRVANADIQYGGDGVLNDANQMGWLARFFNSPWMPF